MDENNKALNNEAEEINSPAESPTGEQKAPEEATQPTVATEGEAAETEGEDQKKGYSQRVRELNLRAKNAEEKAQSLEEKLAEITGSVEPTKTGYNPPQQYNPQEPLVKDGEEISVSELNKRIAAREQGLLQQADARGELRQRQSEAINRINNEAGEVVRAYPELDPENENFNKDLSESITEATEAYVRNNPYTASVKKFVARLMKPFKGAVEAEAGKASEQIVKQQSQAALRPTNVSRQEKTASEMTIAELEAKLGVVQS